MAASEQPDVQAEKVERVLTQVGTHCSRFNGGFTLIGKSSTSTIRWMSSNRSIKSHCGSQDFSSVLCIDLKSCVATPLTQCRFQHSEQIEPVDDTCEIVITQVNPPSSWSPVRFASTDTSIVKKLENKRFTWLGRQRPQARILIVHAACS